MSQTLSIFIDRKVIVLKETDKVMQAARAMCENQVGCIIVADKEAQISGIVTDRDLVCNTISNDLSGETPISQVMESDLVFLSEEAEIDEAIAVMAEYGIRRLPIIERSEKGKRRCVGIVTLDDLIVGNFISSRDLVDIVKSQIIRKKQIFRRASGDKSRLSQSYNKFVAHFAKNLELDREEADDIVQFVLGSIVRRLHYTGGVHFVAQLPKLLQERLLDLPAGPDRTINDRTIVQGISIRTGKDLKSSRQMANHFWKALESWIDPHEADHVLNQLPDRMRDLFRRSHEDVSESFSGRTAI